MTKLIALKPHISEKSFTLASQGKYVFTVSRDSNKNSIKESVAKLFKVTALAVNIISFPGKIKRSKSGIGKRKDIRKAIVTLKKGDRIDLFETEDDEKDKSGKAKEDKNTNKKDKDIKTETAPTPEGRGSDRSARKAK